MRNAGDGEESRRDQSDAVKDEAKLNVRKSQSARLSSQEVEELHESLDYPASSRTRSHGYSKEDSTHVTQMTQMGEWTGHPNANTLRTPNNGARADIAGQNENADGLPPVINRKLKPLTTSGVASPTPPVNRNDKPKALVMAVSQNLAVYASSNGTTSTSSPSTDHGLSDLAAASAGTPAAPSSTPEDSLPDSAIVKSLPSSSSAALKKGVPPSPPPKVSLGDAKEAAEKDRVRSPSPTFFVYKSPPAPVIANGSDSSNSGVPVVDSSFSTGGKSSALPMSSTSAPAQVSKLQTSPSTALQVASKKPLPVPGLKRNDSKLSQPDSVEADVFHPESSRECLALTQPPPSSRASVVVGEYDDDFPSLSSDEDESVPTGGQIVSQYRGEVKEEVEREAEFEESIAAMDEIL